MRRRVGLANGRERLREDFLHGVGDEPTQLSFETAAAVGACQLVVDPPALGRVDRNALLLLELGNPPLQLLRAPPDGFPELLRLRLDLGVGQGRELLLALKNLVEEGLDPLQLPIVARAEQRSCDGLEHDKPLSIQPGLADVRRDGIGNEPM